jgi:hypothetical protein
MGIHVATVYLDSLVHKKLTAELYPELTVYCLDDPWSQVDYKDLVMVFCEGR